MERTEGLLGEPGFDRETNNVFTSEPKVSLDDKAEVGAIASDISI